MDSFVRVELLVVGRSCQMAEYTLHRSRGIVEVHSHVWSACTVVMQPASQHAALGKGGLAEALYRPLLAAQAQPSQLCGGSGAGTYMSRSWQGASAPAMRVMGLLWSAGWCGGVGGWVCHVCYESAAKRH
jgi:hypothetical protein